LLSELSFVHADSVLLVGTLNSARDIQQICFGSADSAFSSLEVHANELIRSLEQASELCPNDSLQEHGNERLREAIWECHTTLEEFRLLRNSSQEVQHGLWFQSPLILQGIENIRMRLNSNVTSLNHQMIVHLQLVTNCPILSKAAEKHLLTQLVPSSIELWKTIESLSEDLGNLQ